MKEENQQSQRKIKKWELAFLWMDSKNQCPICEQKLIIPIGEYDSLSEKFKKEFDTWKKNHKKHKNKGVIAHNISHSNLKYPKKFEKLAITSGKEIRPRDRRYDSFDDLIKNKTGSLKKYLSQETYTSEIIEHYWNKIILCYECSMKIDGRTFENEKEFKSFFNNFHTKDANKQVKEIIRMKEDVALNKTYSDNIFKDLAKVLEDRTFSISFSTQEDFSLIDEILKQILGDIDMDKVLLDINKNQLGDQLEDKIWKILRIINNNKSMWDLLSNADLRKNIKKILPKDQNKIKEVKFSNNNENKNEPIYHVDFKFWSLKNSNAINVEFNISNLNDSLIKERKNFIDFKKGLENKKDYKSAIASNWISNIYPSNIELRKKKEYLSFKNLLIKQLDDFIENQKSSANKKFQSFSVAYMARWGSGKTTIIRELAKDLKSLYNAVEINLWHISNSISSKNIEDNKDNSFVRIIVKEALTQLFVNKDLINKYMDSSRATTEFSTENDVKKQMIESLLQFPKDTKPETIFRERAKLLDQHISSLTRVTETIFNITFKPTIFIFDDIDRVEDEKSIVQLLDSLIAFLNMPNSVYIIPIDEAKIMKAISNIKIGKDPYLFINKYFTYSIRAPFIPRLNAFKNLVSIVKDLDMEKVFVFKGEKSLEKSELLSKSASLFPTSYRGMKDYLNAYQNNVFVFEDNKFVMDLYQHAKIKSKRITKKNKHELIMLATILQIESPLLSDYLSHDLNRKDDLFKVLEKKDNKKSDLFNILDILKGNGNESEEIAITNSEFWSSLLNIDVPKNDYSKAKNLKDAIDRYIESTSGGQKKQQIESLIIIKLEKIIEIFNTFDILGNKNSAYKLLFWTLFTLAEINDEDAINFASNIEFFAAMSNSNDDECKRQIKNIFKEKEFENDKKRGLKNFLDNSYLHHQKGFISLNEYNNIISNLLNVNFKFDFNNEIFISDLIKIMLAKEDSQLILNLFSKISINTRRKILNFLNSKNWNFEYNNKSDNKNKISNKQLVEIIEANNEDIELQINRPEERGIIELKTKFRFAFILKNLSIFTFLDPLPLDTNELKKSKKDYKRLVMFIANHSNEIIDIDEATNDLKNVYFTNRKLVDFKFKNISNLCHFISKSQDFTNLNMFDGNVLLTLVDNDYLVKNIKSTLIHSPKLYNKKVKLDGKDSQPKFLMSHPKIIEKFIYEKSEIDNLSVISIIFKYINKLINSKSEPLLKKILDNEINQLDNNKYEEIDKWAKVIEFFDAASNFKNKIQKKIGFHPKLAYKGEPLLKTTPISEILKENIIFSQNVSSEILIKPSDLVEIIDSTSSKEVSTFLNPRRNSTKYKTLSKIFTFLEKDYPYRFYRLPNAEGYDDANGKKINNENLILKINKELSYKSLKQLATKRMPKYRLSAIKSHLIKFNNEINKYKNYGYFYKSETNDEITKLNQTNAKFIESNASFIRKWLPNLKIAKNINIVKEQIILAKAKKEEKENKIKILSFEDLLVKASDWANDYYKRITGGTKFPISCIFIDDRIELLLHFFVKIPSEETHKHTDHAETHTFLSVKSWLKNNTLKVKNIIIFTASTPCYHCLEKIKSFKKVNWKIYYLNDKTRNEESKDLIGIFVSTKSGIKKLEYKDSKNIDLKLRYFYFVYNFLFHYKRPELFPPIANASEIVEKRKQYDKFLVYLKKEFLNGKISINEVKTPWLKDFFRKII